MDFLFHLLHEKQQEGRIIFLKTIKVHTKGQLISKGLFGILNYSKKTNEQIQLNYYDTSGQLCFRSIFGII